MKKLSLLSLGAVLFVSVQAQSEKYMKAMQDKMMAVDTTMKPDALMALSASFERIGNAEKTQWLPYYYAAFTQINAAYMMMGSGGNLVEKLDPVADKAEAMLGKAQALAGAHSEIEVIKKMIANIRSWADPMNRFMKFKPAQDEAMAKAKQLNPDNPRIYILEAEDKLYTPPQFGGSKEKAKELFNTALQKFETFKPASGIDPNWGRGRTQYGLNQANQ